MTAVDPRLLIGLCLAVLAAPQAARGEGVGCAPVVRGNGLQGRWARSLAEVQRTLADRDDVDRCVELVVTPAARGVRVVARLAAGGDATRMVDSPDDLAPTILALLLVPAPVPVVAPPPTPVPVEAPPVALPRYAAPHPPASVTGDLRVATPAPAAGATAHFEIGVAMAARWQHEVTLGAGGFADVALGRWLVGAS